MSWTDGPNSKWNSSNPNQKTPVSNHRNPNQKDNGNNRRSVRVGQDDVAATFTEKGLETFSKIFATSVESAISRVLPDAIERVIDAKLRDEIASLREEVNELRSMLSQSSPATPVEISSATQERAETNAVSKPVVESSKSVSRYHTGDVIEDQFDQELSALLKVMKELGRPVKSDELRSLLPEIKWSSNPSVKLSNLMIKSNGQIERVGRGFYAYVNRGE